MKQLLPLLADSRPEIANAAALALGISGQRTAAEALLRKLADGPNQPTPFLLALLGGLDRTGLEPGDAETVMAHATTSIQDVRILVHALLRQVENPLADRHLALARNDTLREVRWHCIRSLGQGPASVNAVAILIYRLPLEADAVVRPQILKYLYRMTGQRLGPDPADWAAWWARAQPTYDPRRVRLTPAAQLADAKSTVTQYFTLEITRDRLIFLLDISGSMSQKITVPEGPLSTRRIQDKKLNFAKRELIRVLERFRKGTSYNVLAFSDEYTPLWKKLKPATPKNTKKAIEVVQSLAARGGTNIYDTLAHALEDRRVEAIYLLSDGEPSAGTIKEPDEILAAVRERNGKRAIEIHTIDLSGQSLFLSKLSRENNGQYVSALFWQ